MRKPHILIVDDEESICTFLTFALEDKFIISTAQSEEVALKILDKENIQLVLLDLILGEANGLNLLKIIKENNNEISVIMMTAFGDITSSVKAIKLGAYHYLCKPLNIEELLVYINQALDFQNLANKVENLSSEIKELEKKGYYGDLVGKSAAMQRIYNMIDRLKDVDIGVIVTGESGTGKELVTRALHNSGSRKNESFITINCAAIPEGLLEEELFGHKKGSFTGAISDRKGKLELANKGTLFLDEIGDMPLKLQSKLLRVIQEKEYMPIGGTKFNKVDIRIISATNRDLLEMVKKGLFRKDLYYRLHVVEIHMPALREKKQDIPELCETILARIIADTNKNIPIISQEAMRLLMHYNYPGNVRELVNALEYATILCKNQNIEARDLPKEIQSNINSSNNQVNVFEMIKTYFSNYSIKDIEKMLIRAALENNSLNKHEIAEKLGISDRSLFYKIKEYELDK